MMATQQLVTGSSLATLILALSACAASPERPERELARAESAIELVAENGGEEYGQPAFDRARARLDRARQAAAEGDYREALRLAEEAELDAEVAAAQTSHLKAQEALTDINGSIEVLRREIERAQSSQR